MTGTLLRCNLLQRELSFYSFKLEKCVKLVKNVIKSCPKNAALPNPEWWKELFDFCPTFNTWKL